MHRKKLLDQLDQYKKTNLFMTEEREIFDRLMAFIGNNQNCFERSNIGHITSSIWIVNHQKDAALLTHHRKLNMWLQLGGHNDGAHDCKAVALKEAREESGIENLEFLRDGIFDIDIHPIPGACAYHYDIRYLLIAPKGSFFTVSEESNDLAWIPFEQITNYSRERSVVRMNEKFLLYKSSP